MIRNLTPLVLALILVACADGQAPAGNASGKRHFPRHEKIVPREPLPDPSGFSAGALTYGMRCQGCHEPATAGAPDRVALAQLTPEAIVRSHATDKMQLIGPDFPEQQMREVAAFLTGKTMPAANERPQAKP